MNPQAKRLLGIRSLVSMEIAAGCHKIVTIDAQLDALELDEADRQKVSEIRDTQDAVMADAVTNTHEICVEVPA